MKSIYTWHESGFYGRWLLNQIWIKFNYSFVKWPINTHQLWQNRHKYPTLAQRQHIFYLHQPCMMVDHYTHEKNTLIHLRFISTNIQKLLNNGHKCYILAQSHDIFYMYQAPNVVDCCTKYELQVTLSFPRNHNKHVHFMQNIAIITQICHGAKCYFTCNSNT